MTSTQEEEPLNITRSEWTKINAFCHRGQQIIKQSSFGYHRRRLTIDEGILSWQSKSIPLHNIRQLTIGIPPKKLFRKTDGNPALWVAIDGLDRRCVSLLFNDIPSRNLWIRAILFNVSQLPEALFAESAQDLQDALSLDGAASNGVTHTPTLSPNGTLRPQIEPKPDLHVRVESHRSPDCMTSTQKEEPLNITQAEWKKINAFCHRGQDIIKQSSFGYHRRRLTIDEGILSWQSKSIPLHNIRQLTIGIPPKKLFRKTDGNAALWVAIDGLNRRCVSLLFHGIPSRNLWIRAILFNVSQLPKPLFVESAKDLQVALTFDGAASNGVIHTLALSPNGECESCSVEAKSL